MRGKMRLRTRKARIDITKTMKTGTKVERSWEMELESDSLGVLVSVAGLPTCSSCQRGSLVSFHSATYLALREGRW